MMRKLFVTAVAAALGCLALAQGDYAITNLGSFKPKAINSYGQMVGGDENTEVYSLWTPVAQNALSGFFTPFIDSRYDLFILNDINDYGQIVGGSFIDRSNPSDPGELFIFTPSVRNGTTGTPFWTYGIDLGMGLSINGWGSCAYKGASFFGVHVADLPNQPGGYNVALPPFTTGEINDYGQVAGHGPLTGIPGTFQAGIWTPTTPASLDGTLALINSLNPAGDTFVGGINAQGQVCGEYIMPNGLGHAYIWSPSAPNGDTGTMVDIDPDPARASVANAIANNGTVVGNFFVDVNGTSFSRAFIYRDGVMSDLNSALPPNAGYVLVHAADVNDFGQVACVARATNGDTFGMLLTPVPIDYDVNALRDAVTALVNSGAILPANGSSLLDKLNAALAKINAGDFEGAIGDLGAFINQVNSFVKKGRLSATQGQALIDAANEAIDDLS